MPLPVVHKTTAVAFFIAQQEMMLEQTCKSNETDEGASRALFVASQTTIQSQRSTKKYCSAVSSKSQPQSTESASSKTKARTNAEFLISQKTSRSYIITPEKRLGFMQSLIAEARAGNTKLREVLTNQNLETEPDRRKASFPSFRTYLLHDCTSSTVLLQTVLEGECGWCGL